MEGVDSLKDTTKNFLRRKIAFTVLRSIDGFAMGEGTSGFSSCREYADGIIS